MADYPSIRTNVQASSVRKLINENASLYLSEFLSGAHLENESELAPFNRRRRIFTPSTTLRAFMSQITGDDQTCEETLVRLNIERVSQGLKPASTNTGSYCKAREKLSEKAIRRLVLSSSERIQREASSLSLWKGYNVKLVDGSTASMPDTIENQREYPQQHGQKQGLGFPILRLVVILSLANGSVIDAAIGPYKGHSTNEQALLRSILHHFTENDVFLADAYFCTYFLFAQLQSQNVNVVCRKLGARKVDFRKGKKVGKYDQITRYLRPKKPSWMDATTYKEFPESIIVRESKVFIEKPGFRTKSMVIVSTFVDHKKIVKSDLADLYRKRWHAELDLRSIKITMRMDVLRCKSPSMIRKEIWTHMLAYNLIRLVLLQSALKAGIAPRNLSFKSGLRAMRAYQLLIALAPYLDPNEVYDYILCSITVHRVGTRPNRIEPRAVKRRPKKQKLLMVPRKQARKAILTRVSR